jgi:hypothetical protein
MKGDTSELIKPIQKERNHRAYPPHRENGFERFVVGYRNQGPRKLVWRSALADAAPSANKPIDEITAGRGEVLNLKSADAQAVIRAVPF